MAEVAANASICQPIFGMENYWTAGESFGEACLPGAEDQVTLENAAEKTAELNEQMNGSLVD
jgi:hypothetical protein